MLVLTAGGCLVAAAADTPASPPAASAVEPAANGTANTTASTSTDTAPNDLADLAKFLSLPPARITQLRKALDYLDNMSQAQRDVLLRDVQARQNSARQLRQDINTDLQQFSASDRSILARYEATLFPEDLQLLIKRFHDVEADAAARKSIIQEMLKTATDKGIKAQPPPTDHPNPTGGGGRGKNSAGNGGSAATTPAASAATTP